MKNKVNLILLLIIIFIAITACKNTNNINKKTKEQIKTKEVNKEVKAIINEKEYIINLEDNETVTSFIEMLPLNITMTELNGNEKYINLDKTLPTNSTVPEKINSGDVMIFGNNCLVIFYKSFDTTYSYTKIGHINDLPNLGNENINIKIIKE